MTISWPMYDHAAFFAVSHDPADEAEARLTNRVPGVRVFWDFDLTVARLYGACARDADPSDNTIALSRFWVVIDPTLRIIATIPFRSDGGDVAECLALVRNLPPPARFAGVELQAPILRLPRVFEPAFCNHLIRLYEASGGTEGGFMRDIGGRTVGVNDPGHRRRKDFNITDQTIITALQARVLRRVVPEIAKVHQFLVSRMERYIVSCYAAEDGRHFAAHRDNTT